MNGTQIVPALHVGQPSMIGPVTLFPVWAQVRPVTGLVTGVSALVEVTEVDGGPAVGRLSVYNPGTHPVLLVEGELLEGGWQTRACVQDVVVAPRERVDIQVACVEQHRWNGGTAHDRRARRVTSAVQGALRAPAPTRQTAVWDGVRRHETTAGTATGSLADHLDRVGGVTTPPLLDGQKGVIVGVAGQPVALELFGNRAALAAHLSGIVEAALLEGELAGPVIAVPGRRARRFAARIEHTPWTAALPDPGVWAGRTDRVDLRALTVGKGLAHLAAVATAL